MASPEDRYASMRSLTPLITQKLHQFARQTSADYQHLFTFPSNSQPPHGATTPLTILDSSFNPPTLAHLSLIRSSPPPPRVLLLLATQNADKAPSPASFPNRVAMMCILASYVPPPTVVDVAVTKHARFLDKSTALRKAYPDAEQVYLTGYDTLIRLLDTKYYPVSYTLEPLEEFFKRNRVRCTWRHSDEYGGRETQARYLERIRNGEREGEGCRREWADRIEFVENSMEGAVSSTMAREAARKQDETALDRLVPEMVEKYVLENGVYSEKNESQ